MGGAYSSGVDSSPSCIGYSLLENVKQGDLPTASGFGPEMPSQIGLVKPSKNIFGTLERKQQLTDFLSCNEVHLLSYSGLHKNLRGKKKSNTSNNNLPSNNTPRNKECCDRLLCGYPGTQICFELNGYKFNDTQIFLSDCAEEWQMRTDFNDKTAQSDVQFRSQSPLTPNRMMVPGNSDRKSLQVFYITKEKKIKRIDFEKYGVGESSEDRVASIFNNLDKYLTGEGNKTNLALEDMFMIVLTQNSLNLSPLNFNDLYPKSSSRSSKNKIQCLHEFETRVRKVLFDEQTDQILFDFLNRTRPRKYQLSGFASRNRPNLTDLEQALDIISLKVHSNLCFFDQVTTYKSLLVKPWVKKSPGSPHFLQVSTPESRSRPIEVPSFDYSSYTISEFRCLIRKWTGPEPTSSMSPGKEQLWKSAFVWTKSFRTYLSLELIQQWRESVGMSLDDVIKTSQKCKFVITSFYISEGLQSYHGLNGKKDDERALEYLTEALFNLLDIQQPHSSHAATASINNASMSQFIRNMEQCQDIRLDTVELFETFFDLLLKALRTEVYTSDRLKYLRQMIVSLTCAELITCEIGTDFTPRLLDQFKSSARYANALFLTLFISRKQDSRIKEKSPADIISLKSQCPSSPDALVKTVFKKIYQSVSTSIPLLSSEDFEEFCFSSFAFTDWNSPGFQTILRFADDYWCQVSRLFDETSCLSCHSRVQVLEDFFKFRFFFGKYCNQTEWRESFWARLQNIFKEFHTYEADCPNTVEYLFELSLMQQLLSSTIVRSTRTFHVIKLYVNLRYLQTLFSFKNAKSNMLRELGKEQIESDTEMLGRSCVNPSIFSSIFQKLYDTNKMLCVPQVDFMNFIEVMENNFEDMLLEDTNKDEFPLGGEFEDLEQSLENIVQWMLQFCWASSSPDLEWSKYCEVDLPNIVYVCLIQEQFVPLLSSLQVSAIVQKEITRSSSKNILLDFDVVGSVPEIIIGEFLKRNKGRRFINFYESLLPPSNAKHEASDHLNGNGGENLPGIQLPQLSKSLSNVTRDEQISVK